MSQTHFTAERPTAFEQINYTKIVAGTEKAFLNIFTRLVGVNQSLTPEDLDIIRFYIGEGHQLNFPAKVPFKENLTTIISELMLSDRGDLNYPKLTVTDVLRVAVGLSGGDVTLPKVPSKMV